jgi:excisionase family DNA binding protein
MSESLTVDEFVNLFKISRSTLYQLWQRKRGPKHYMVGARRYIRRQAALEWINEQEELTSGKRNPDKDEQDPKSKADRFENDGV